ncbi:hypothetical protein [Dendrosporobacter sp. 1207_IL3150]|uniref:hypothetical protein n=1 Tax=Dendrosporobacter sp. 1207_IL3150 TaxID=3084054 RepID=UPI002FD99169
MDSSKNEVDLNSLVLLAALLAIAIAKGRTTNEINIIGNFLSTLGTALTVIGSNQDNTTVPDKDKNVDVNTDNVDLQQQINVLKTKIDELERELITKKSKFN